MEERFLKKVAERTERSPVNPPYRSTKKRWRGYGETEIASTTWDENE